MNNPEPLPPIRTPFSVVWREFRIRVVPFIIFTVVIFAAWRMWKSIPMGNAVRGVGEGLRSVVTSPRIGVLHRLQVQPFQWVEAGDPLVTIFPMDPDAQLDLLQSELQLARLRLEPSMADQNALNYEQVRVDALDLRQQLSDAEVNLVQAESLLARNEKLIKDRLITQDLYELSLRDRNLYQAQVKQITNSLQQIESRLNDLRALGEPQSPGTNQFTRSMIASLETRLLSVETNWNPITLFAPISGQVHLISRQEKEFVVEGEPLFAIASPRSERIVAYMRQPFHVDPQPGMEVEVQMQNQKRLKFVTQIAEVGAQLEVITNALAFIQQGALVDVGLPIILTVPPNVQLRPGEVVSVVVRRDPIKLFGGASASAKPLVQLR